MERSFRDPASKTKIKQLKDELTQKENQVTQLKYQTVANKEIALNAQLNSESSMAQIANDLAQLQQSLKIGKKICEFESYHQ